MKRETIRFYSTSDAYGELSNFAPYPIRLRGKQWPTSEHFFQAQKFSNEREREDVRRAKTPMIAARMGRNRKGSGRNELGRLLMQIRDLLRSEQQS